MKNLNSHPREEIRPLIKYLKAHQRKGDVLYVTRATYITYKYYAKIYNLNFKGTIIGLFADIIRFKDGEPFLYVYHFPCNCDSRLSTAGELSPGKRNPQKHNLTTLEGSKRTWVLFSHYKPEVEHFFLKCLDKIGTKKLTLKEAGAVLYLYDLE